MQHTYTDAALLLIIICHLSAQAPGKASLQERGVVAAPTRRGRRVQLPSQLANRLLLLVPPGRCLQRHRLLLEFAGCAMRVSKNEKQAKKNKVVSKHLERRSFFSCGSNERSGNNTGSWTESAPLRAASCAALSRTRGSRSHMFNSTCVRHAHHTLSPYHIGGGPP